MKFSSKFRYALALGGVVTALAALPAATTAHAAQVYVSVGVAPPGIPFYEQPVCPGDGYIWTPGYWAWGDDGYYWVDGQWVLPPYVGALWTPGWWGYGSGGYFWNAGYWGPTVGYYGGINYGFGYFGTGFYGGYWNSGRFFYNRPYGRFGNGFRGAFYERRYSGFDGRPGGPAFNSHPPIQYIGRNGNNGGYYRGAERGNGVHGQQYNNAGADRGNGYVTRNGFGQSGYAQGAVNRGSSPQAYSAPQTYAGGGRFGGAPATVQQQRSYAGTYGGGNAYGGARGYSAPSQSYGGGHAYAAPSGGFSGGGRMSAPSGGFGGGGRMSAPSGGFGGVGGGGFHGGGGGGFSGGGGFHGGGGHR